LSADPANFEVELSQLRAEIATLANLPALSPEFARWLTRLFAVVKTSFGPDSNEIRQLREIYPELPSEFYDSIEVRISSLGLNSKLGDDLLTCLHKNAPQAVFRRRLYDYDDFIGATILGLRSDC